MSYTDAAAARRREWTAAPSEETSFRKAPSACVYQGRITTAMRVFLAEEWEPVTKATSTKARE